MAHYDTGSILEKIDLNLERSVYELDETQEILTPALAIYPDIVDANIQTTLRLVGGNPHRWRPHIKTAKLKFTLERLINAGIDRFKCATTLELLTACQNGAKDVLVAFSISGSSVKRILQIAAQFPNVMISVLVEDRQQVNAWKGTSIGMFIDLNPGMDRTGIDATRTEEIVDLAKASGALFRGIHYYDGHVSSFAEHLREAKVHEGYTELLALADALSASGVSIAEIITSGTPALPYALSFAGWDGMPFFHSVSPGTVVYNDSTSLNQLPGLGYQAAALVISTVVSRPKQDRVTCDAGHKAVSVDAGVPSCIVLDHLDWTPQKPSEEHLPIDLPSSEANVKPGQRIYLVPRHVCPTVNNFDQALLIRNGRIAGVAEVTARGHEPPLVMDQKSYQ